MNYRNKRHSDSNKDREVNTMSSSLQSLVESFDQKVEDVLENSHKNTSKIAPIPIRSHDEIISESEYVFVMILFFNIL